ncbi:ester cyclase [Natronorubrum sediminis]|nr:ester cyclase [Natronorubrum sediminis]
MSTIEETKDVVQRTSYDTYSGAEELDVIDELVADDFVMHDPFALVGEEVRGRDGLKEHIEVARTTFPDFEYTIHHLIAADDIVAVHFTGRGTNEEAPPGLDVEPTGEVVEFEGMEFDRIEDGKLAETWLLTDALGFLEQLGALPDEE